MGFSHVEYLETLAKDGPEPPDGWTAAVIVAEEGKRVVRNAMLALAAAQIPRRIGGDAGRKQLAADKKLSRKIAQTYLDIWTRMSGAGEIKQVGLPEPRGDWNTLLTAAARNEDARRAGATVIWDDFMYQNMEWLPQRRAQIARWALRAAGVEGEPADVHRFGSRRADLLSVELRGIERVRGMVEA